MNVHYYPQVPQTNNCQHMFQPESKWLVVRLNVMLTNARMANNDQLECE